MMEDEQQKPKSIFDVLNNITYNKQYDESDIDVYNAYTINKGLSQTKNNIFYANEMNKRAFTLDKEMQYDYLFYSVKKQKSFTKWAKSSANVDDMEFIQTVYNVNKKVANDYLRLMDKEMLKKLKEKYNKRGKL